MTTGRGISSAPKSYRFSWFVTPRQYSAARAWIAEYPQTKVWIDSREIQFCGVYQREYAFKRLRDCTAFGAAMERS